MSKSQLELFQSRALFNFAYNISGDKVKKKVIGELNELSIDDISYWYGNGELIASNDKFTTIWSYETMNGIKYI